MTLVLAICLVAACTKWVRMGPSGDADADADADADTDADRDVDSEEEWPPAYCGRLEQVCCDEPYCVDGTTCVTTASAVSLCFRDCTLAPCAYGDETGYCQDVGDFGVCVYGTPEPSACAVGYEGCTTEYGASSNTICLPDTEGVPHCVEKCTPGVEECPEGEHCFALGSGTGAVCAPPA
jgi:hypothetical protein